MKKVEVTSVMAVPSHRVIAAFTELSLLNGWWQVQQSCIQPEPGGLYTLLWNISDQGFGYVTSGIVKLYDADAYLHIEKMIYLNPLRQPLGPMELTVKADAQEEGQTAVSICQSGYQSGGDWDWYYEAVKEAWPQAILSLKEYLESKKVTT